MVFGTGNIGEKDEENKELLIIRSYHFIAIIGEMDVWTVAHGCWHYRVSISSKTTL